MPKLTIEDLKKIREKARGTVTLRKGVGRAKVTVHMGTCGIASGARDIMDAVMNEIETRDIKDVIVTTSGCAGLCSREPMATVELPEKPPVKPPVKNETQPEPEKTPDKTDPEPPVEPPPPPPDGGPASAQRLLLPLG